MAAQLLRTVDKLQANTLLLLLLLLPCIQTLDASLSLAFLGFGFWILGFGCKSEYENRLLGFVQNQVNHQKSNL
jgi:hypothetical protein